MDNKQWLDEVARRLIRAGLPSAYVSRTVAELSDHECESAENESGSVSLATSSASELAGEFIGCFHTGRWYRRIPSFVWLLVPAPLTVLVCMAYYVGGVIVFSLVDSGFESGNPRSSTFVMLIVLFALGKVLTPLLASSALAWTLHRVGRPMWVFTCALAFLAFLFLSTTTSLTLPHRFSEASLQLSITDDWITSGQLCHWQVLQATIVIVTACSFDVLKRRQLRTSL